MVVVVRASALTLYSGGLVAEAGWTFTRNGGVRPVVSTVKLPSDPVVAVLLLLWVSLSVTLAPAIGLPEAAVPLTDDGGGVTVNVAAKLVTEPETAVI